MPEVRERRRDRHRVSDMGFQVTDDRITFPAVSQRVIGETKWLSKFIRFLAPLDNRVNFLGSFL